MRYYKPAFVALFLLSMAYLGYGLALKVKAKDDRAYDTCVSSFNQYKNNVSAIPTPKLQSIFDSCHRVQFWAETNDSKGLLVRTATIFFEYALKERYLK